MELLAATSVVLRREYHSCKSSPVIPTSPPPIFHTKPKAPEFIHLQHCQQTSSLPLPFPIPLSCANFPFPSVKEDTQNLKSSCNGKTLLNIVEQSIENLLEIFQFLCLKLYLVYCTTEFTAWNESYASTMHCLNC